MPCTFEKSTSPPVFTADVMAPTTPPVYWPLTVDAWVPGKLADALSERERRAQLVLELDDAVNAAVAKLKEKGLQSPYLKNFVVARINPLRFIKGEPPPLDELLKGMTAKALKMDADKVKPGDLAKAGGYGGSDEE